MKPKEAWNRLIKHCRWLGIPVVHSRKRIVSLNGRKIKLLATTNKKMDWYKNFHGAFKVVVYFPKKEKITWDRVSTLVHELGHVLDYRENKLTNKGIISTEKTANRYGFRLMKLLEIPENLVLPFLNKIIEEYEAVFGKRTIKKMELVWRQLNEKRTQSI